MLGAIGSSREVVSHGKFLVRKNLERGGGDIGGLQKLGESRRGCG